MSIVERGALAIRLLDQTTKIRAYLTEDTGALTKWRRIFGDDIDVCLRARNNIDVRAPISLSNLRAAVQIAETLTAAAELVDDA